MNLRTRFIIYLIGIHLVFMGGAFYAFRGQPAWILSLETFFLISGILGFRLIRALVRPLDFMQTGSDLIEESDYTVRFRETGQAEMDRLITVYNRMVDHLRGERTQVQELNYFLDKIVTASPGGVITCDFDRRIVLINPSAERLLGITSEEAVGRTLADLQSDFDRALEALEIGTSEVIPLRGQRRVKCWKTEFFDRGFARVVITLEELTDELRLYEKRAYEKVIRIMAHEVNNTTGAVSSLLGSALHYKNQVDADDREDFTTALEVAAHRTEHLNAFMSRFAEVVRMPQPELHPCDVHRMLKELAVLLKPECEQRRIEWMWDVQQQVQPVQMDQYQMERAFVNILKNAIEAIGQNGTLTIRLGLEDETPFVIIEDTGAGLTPEVQAGLFTPFFSTKPDGHGLGLILVQEILNRHGFDFSLERVGDVTRFRINFENPINVV